jgi:hypothetical protein
VNPSVQEGPYRAHGTSSKSLEFCHSFTFLCILFCNVHKLLLAGGVVSSSYPCVTLAVSPASGVTHNVTFLSRDQLRLLLFRDV